MLGDDALELVGGKDREDLIDGRRERFGQAEAGSAAREQVGEHPLTEIGRASCRERV